MDSNDDFAPSWAHGQSSEAASSPGSAGGAASAICDQILVPTRFPLPRALTTAQGYLELATGAAAKLGLAPRLRRQMLRKSLRLAAAFRCEPHGIAGGSIDAAAHDVAASTASVHALNDARSHQPKVAQQRAMRQLLIGQSLRLLGRYELAVLALKKATADRLLRRDALLALAWCYKRLGRLDEAVTTITRALAAAPDDAILHYNLACYLALSVQPRAALYELAWSLELKPQLQTRAASECDFDSLRGSAAFEALIDPQRRLARRPAGS
jgi:tetratricopeptide (TPR) repeat protein